MPIGIFPGIMSKFMNFPSGHSIMFHNNFTYEMLVKECISTNFSATPSVLFRPEITNEISWGSNQLKEIAICEKSRAGYCVTQEGLRSSGFVLDSERTQGKYLSPSICIMDCKTKAQQM